MPASVMFTGGGGGAKGAATAVATSVIARFPPLELLAGVRDLLSPEAGVRDPPFPLCEPEPLLAVLLELSIVIAFEKVLSVTLDTDATLESVPESRVTGFDVPPVSETTC